MKILITVGIVLASVIALILIVALFVKNDYKVQREVVINKPKGEVFSYIRFLKNQDKYSKWSQIDPSMEKTYRGVDGNVGFVYAWDSDNKNAGKGEQEIREIREGEKMDTELRFIKPFPGRADASLVTEAISENQTRVRWILSSRMKYPMNIMLLFMNMEKMIGKDLEVGLTNLKGVMEKQPALTTKM
jgi:hypothetical protein